MTKRNKKKRGGPKKESSLLSPSDKGVDHFLNLEPMFVPEWVGWLHRQAKLGFANKVTATQVGFTIGPHDIAFVPELEDILAVVLGYGPKS